MRRRLALGIAGWIALSASAVASAAPHEVRVPLRDGKLSTADLLARVHLPDSCARHLPDGAVDVRSFGGSLFVAALDRALGQGCNIRVTDSAMILHIDTDKLPGDVDGVKQATRTFTAAVAPVATAAQHFGLALPKSVDPAKPLVVVIHGLDMTARDMAAMDGQLAKAGYQTADFDYPADGPVVDDVALLAKHLAAVQQTYPGMKVNIVAFSMGGLIARGYVEGADYAGRVDRLILIATPNHGSSWAPMEFASKLRMTAEQIASDPHWHPTWFITSGLGEAGRDLRPGSKFLAQLNDRPRCATVRYTIVNGDQSPTSRMAASVVGAPAKWVPNFARNWWGVRQTCSGLTRAADSVRGKHATSDGPVTLASTRLPGVTDVVTVHADHCTIYACATDGVPAAWPTVRDRLAAP